MSRKGGYKILNLSDLFFDTGTSKEVPGIYDLVSALESKVTLISGLDIDDVPQDDMFVTWVNDSGTYKATIGDQTIAVASDDSVLITDGIIGGGGSGPTTVEAEDVTYDNSTSGLEAENVQDAIDELAGKEPPTPQIDADDVDYDNAGSGLQATNVQAAVNELAGRAEGVPTLVTGIGYNLTSSFDIRRIGADLDDTSTNSDTTFNKNASTTVTNSAGLVDGVYHLVLPIGASMTGYSTNNVGVSSVKVLIWDSGNQCKIDPILIAVKNSTIGTGIIRITPYLTKSGGEWYVSTISAKWAIKET